MIVSPLNMTSVIYLSFIKNGLHKLLSCLAKILGNSDKKTSKNNYKTETRKIYKNFIKKEEKKATDWGKS